MQIFDQIPLYTGSRPLRVNKAQNNILTLEGGTTYILVFSEIWDVFEKQAKFDPKVNGREIVWARRWFKGGATLKGA